MKRRLGYIINELFEIQNILMAIITILCMFMVIITLSSIILNELFNIVVSIPFIGGFLITIGVEVNRINNEYNKLLNRELELLNFQLRRDELEAELIRIEEIQQRILNTLRELEVAKFNYDNTHVDDIIIHNIEDLYE